MLAIERKYQCDICKNTEDKNHLSRVKVSDVEIYDEGEICNTKHEFDVCPECAMMYTLNQLVCKSKEV